MKTNCELPFNTTLTMTTPTCSNQYLYCPDQPDSGYFDNLLWCKKANLQSYIFYFCNSIYSWWSNLHSAFHLEYWSGHVWDEGGSSSGWEQMAKWRQGSKSSTKHWKVFQMHNPFNLAVHWQQMESTFKAELEQAFAGRSWGTLTRSWCSMSLKDLRKRAQASLITLIGRVTQNTNWQC